MIFLLPFIENELEQPSSPSVKKSEEKGIVVVHEIKCKLYVKVFSCESLFFLFVKTQIVQPHWMEPMTPPSISYLSGEAMPIGLRASRKLF
jgi:hypothetical protein